MKTTAITVARRIVTIGGKMVATDGQSFWLVSRRGKTNPVYTIEDVRLYPVRVVGGVEFVSIPE